MARPSGMTPLIRRYIKTSFIFLLTGLLLGAYIVDSSRWGGSASSSEPLSSC